MVGHRVTRAQPMIELLAADCCGLDAASFCGDQHPTDHILVGQTDVPETDALFPQAPVGCRSHEAPDLLTERTRFDELAARFGQSGFGVESQHGGSQLGGW
ncbi:hypothetical protein DIZ27_02030 [Streptomyces sp. NWU339]|nr:hypothetical protein DIZ27_02030 [Streptomyces sp. NWU339]